MRRGFYLAVALAGGCHWIGGIDSAELACMGDGVPNGLETGIDCGGPCNKCDVDQLCERPEDCKTGLCYARLDELPRCEFTTCYNGEQDGLETDVDCGGPYGPEGERCPRCWGEEQCTTDDDCAANADLTLMGSACVDGECVSTCCTPDCGAGCLPAECAKCTKVPMLTEECEDDECPPPLDCLETDDTDDLRCQ